MAAVDTTISGDTWWTTGAGAGADDGSSFVNRMTIPTGLGTITQNVDAALTLVLETSNGIILLGNGEAALKRGNFYGIFKCVGGDNTFNSLKTGGAYAAIRCVIGGTTAYKEGEKKYYHPESMLANIDSGCNAGLTATGNIKNSNALYDGYFYNCTFQEFIAYRGTYMAFPILENCTLNGSASGTKYIINLASSTSKPWLINCTLASSYSTLAYYFKNVIINIVGSLTLTGGMILRHFLLAQGFVEWRYWRRAFIRTDPVAVLFSGHEASDNKFSFSGLSDGSGDCLINSPTDNDCLWALQKIDKYLTVTNDLKTMASPTETDTYGDYDFAFQKTGYVAEQHTHDFTDGADWGTAGSPIDITLVAGITPTISNPSFDKDPINLNEQLMVTADETNTEEAFVVFYDPDGSGEIIYSQHMFVGGGKIKAVIPPNSLKAGVYGAGEIKLKAIGGGASAIDSTLTLTVNPKVLPDYEVYQGEVVKRLIQLMMDYEDNQGIKIFEQFKGHIFYNPKRSTPTYPAMFIFVGSGNREPLAIKRQDWWNIDIKVYFYTKDPTETSMNDHYKWIEGLDRVCRVNPRWDLDGEPDLAIHKGDLETWNFDFTYGDNFVISETEATVTVRTKVCLANQIS